MTEMIIEIQTSEVMFNLERLEGILSPEGMAYFLGVEVEPYLQRRAKERFDKEVDPQGMSWAPLRPATQEIRSNELSLAVAGAHPINRRTGELEDYITQSNANIMPTTYGASLRYPGGQPAKGELREKVKTAQQGKDEPRTVARPVLGVDENDMVYVISRLMFFMTNPVAISVSASD